MSWGTGWPDGFIAHVKWRFPGNIPPKIWKQFRTKFSKEHAAGWEVRKNFSSGRPGEVVVNFHTTDPAVAATMPPEQWDFLKATIGLLTVQT